MPKPVLYKDDFVRRFQAGEFGNRPKTWSSVYDWTRQAHVFKPGQLLHLRNRVKGGETHYNVKPEELFKWATEEKWVHDWNWYVSEMAPTDKTLLQGELRRSERGHELFCSRQAMTMREALAYDGKTVTGLQALMTLQCFIDTPSYEHLMDLLDEYPDHVVEFSTYSVPCGLFAKWGFRTMIWEVRKY